MCSSPASATRGAAEARIVQLREVLGSCGAAAAFLRDTPSIAWLTAFHGVFDDEQAHAAFLPAEAGSLRVHTDSRYITAMEREAAGTPVEVDARAQSFAAWALEAWEGLRGTDAGGASDLARLAIEDSITLSQYRALEHAFRASSPFVETSGLVASLRAVKDADEIRRMRAAQAITDAGFEHIVSYLRPGMTERDVQMELDWFMMRNGAEGLAFPTIIACGENSASPHAIASDKRLEAGQCVVMDFGARCKGYCSDMTRTVFLGEPEGEMLRAWETLLEANERVEAMLRPGVTGKEAHELALAVLAEGGFEGRMGHGLGHGVGIEVHEEPVLSPRNPAPLVPGNVVTVEPGIYIPGSFGMRLEDFGVVTEQGFDVLTSSTHELVVV